VIPDLPLEESAELIALGDAYGLELILFVAPTSPPERLQKIALASQGFIYLVSLTGTTGARTGLAQGLPERIAQLRTLTNKPIAVGFGISTPEQARQVAQWGADGVIVGSACVRLLAETPVAQRQIALGNFCSALRNALDA